ncbi:MAG: heparan-alpha-glucosaminide N-acetyltransferase domain-containing protein [Bacteroidota bacterium]
MTIENKRILSIDILRGFVMIVMALDHTRDFFLVGGITTDPMNPDTTHLSLFLTRLVTHLCAPTFVFLSGISAYLSSKNKDPKQASNFLIKRGIWLLFVEIVIITLGLTFNPLYNVIILQVIWAIGWSMILLGILSRISHRLILIVGLILFFGHNLLNYIQLPDSNTLVAQILNITLTSSGTFIPLSETHFIGVFYVILPWTGAMFIGFSIGHWYTKEFDATKRRKWLFLMGLGLFLSFLILRYFGLYGNPTPRKEYIDPLKTFFSFLNVSKYPPSLQYYGMTLGLTIMLLSQIENLKNRFTKLMTVYGNVPFFYYVLHFYLIHFILVIVFFASGYGIKDIVNPQVPFLFHPPSLGFSLPIVYLIWIGVIALLYRPCIWFQNYKATHNQWWLKYL